MKLKSGHIKKRDILTIAGTYQVGNNHQPVVAKRNEKKLLDTMLFNEWHPTRTLALQRAHYINANHVMHDRILPTHTIGATGTLKQLQERGYEL